VSEVKRLLIEHLHDHYSLYGEYSGVRTARKHIGWYVRALPGGEAFRQEINALEDSASQVLAVAQFLDHLNDRMDRIPARVSGAAPLDASPAYPLLTTPTPVHMEVAL
jgi:tRNA-dihydrouridine synthase B